MEMNTMNNSHNHENHHEHMVADFKKRFFVSLIFTIPVIILSPFFQDLFGYQIKFSFGETILLFISAFIYFYGGWPFLKGMGNEIKNKNPGMMTLIGIAITVSFIYSALVSLGLKGSTFYWELATLIDIMLIGHWIEMRSVMGASKALEELIKLMPNEAHLINNEEIRDIKTSDLKVGDIVLVKPGERIPLDGEIIKGETSIDESMITGESKPAYLKTGQEVIGGSINIDGSIQVKIQKVGKDTYLSQIYKLVKTAQQSKSRAQDLANKAAFWLTIISISTGTLTLIVWTLLGQPFSFSLERMVTVMVIACPHALGLAVPLVISRSTSIAAKKGLLIRNRKPFERFRKVEAVVFDKTGTLTEGKFEVREIITFSENYDKNTLLQIIASVESLSEHPIAQAIVEESKKNKIDTLEVNNFKSITGKGVEGNINGELYHAVSVEYLKDEGIPIPDENKKNKAVSTQVYLLKNKKEVLSVINLVDRIRPQSKATVRSLKELGIKTYMITGDNEEIAKYVSEELGLDGYYASVLPNEKAQKIKELREKRQTVAMVGDGVNDAPALVTADVGIAVGAGTDIAIESADIVLSTSNPQAILDLVHLSKSTYKKIIQNLAWATGYNVITIPLAAGVLYVIGILLSPMIGAVLMSLSAVIVSINANLLK
ncbi:copper-translocating P-type ATPase [Petrotoga halophila]|uniref:ATPase n=1 Tax=Petrotoga halophila DSM 16923 TaxID=1122953 RepID=A0A2S5EB15_9BACT|nr:copper-translocating P-type ATPase [Petrotoga halophila]POZ90225.1 ATPase [Petrotoga halophila DSM 16923]